MGTICKRPQQQSIRSHRMTSIALNQGQLTTKVPATKLQVYTGGCTPITRYPTEGFSRIMLKKGFGVTNQLVVELGFGFRLSLWQRGTFLSFTHTHSHTCPLSPWLLLRLARTLFVFWACSNPEPTAARVTRTRIRTFTPLHPPSRACSTMAVTTLAAKSPPTMPLKWPLATSVLVRVSPGNEWDIQSKRQSRLTELCFYYYVSEIGMDLINLKANKVAVYTDSNVSFCDIILFGIKLDITDLTASVDCKTASPKGCR